MQIFLVLALLIAILAVIFAVQNVAVVGISFFAWKVDLSLAVALLIALAAGVLITLLLSLPGKIKGSWNSATMKKKWSSLEAERDGLKQKVDQLSADRDGYIKKWEASAQEISSLEEELASLSAALQEKEPASGLAAPPFAPEPATPPPGESQPRPVVDLQKE